MTEKVQTGGIKTFQYEKGYKPRLEENQKKEIKEAYEQYYARRKKEKRNKAWIIVGIIILILMIVLWISIK